MGYLKKVPHDVVDRDPTVQAFFLATDDGGVLEVKRQRTQVFSETLHDLIGPG